MNAAVAVYWQVLANAGAQHCSTIFRKGHAVAWCWCLPAKKRCPVVIKVLEYRRGIDWSDFHTIEPCMLKKACQRLWVAYGKAPTLVEGKGVCIQSNCCIPEVTHHLHLAGVIPNVCRNRASRPRCSFHF